jgi:hypothetical protein
LWRDISFGLLATMFAFWEADTAKTTNDARRSDRPETSSSSA